jgi:hypothetical protein
MALLEERLPMKHAKSAYRRRMTVPIPPQAEHPEWIGGTVIYTDAAGVPVGYGVFRRSGGGEVELIVSFEPSAVSLLSQSQQPADE